MRNQSQSPVRGLYRRFASVASALASEVYSGLGSELSLRARAHLERGEFFDLVSLQVDPSNYNDAGSFRDDYLACELMSKFPSWDLGIDPKQVALRKFAEAEHSCSQTNLRLALPLVSSCYSLVTPESLIWSARVKIEKLLGPFSWDAAEQFFGFGPGSTTSLLKSQGDAYFKFGAKPHSTKENAVLGYCAIKRIPRWFDHLAGLSGETPESLDALPLLDAVERVISVVPGNRIITVPKNAKTDRTIAKEPDLNMFIQKGIGELLRRALKRVGVDLDDQSRNQRLSLEGSITGSLATVDLSAASDTVSLRLVEELLPPDWVLAIKLCRSPRGILPSGEQVTYQKVSSMGNGFTFELEALIFWALVRSVVDTLKPSDRRVAVYGDDLIFSCDIYGTVVWLLDFCGFTVNAKKSFATGPFRESCGKHYFAGHDVTPYYVRKDITSPDRLFWFANQTRLWASRCLPWGLDSCVKPAYDRCVGLLPSYLRQPTIPWTLGDIALWGDFDECRPKRLSHGHEGYEARGFIPKGNSFDPDDVPYLLRQLSKLPYHCSTADVLEALRKGLPSDSVSHLNVSDKALGGSGVPSRSLKPSWRIVRPPVARWDSLGPWV